MKGKGAITARLLGQTYVDRWAKAGVMMRRDLTKTSPYMLAGYETSLGVKGQKRAGVGSWAPESDDDLATVNHPYWLRVTRSGKSFAAYGSSDGVTWKTLQQQDIDMPDTIYVGLAMSTCVAAEGQASFDKLSLK